jgi:hypothetical protein
MKKDITVEHKGYILHQSGYCPHYMIFKADTGEMVLHASCTKYLTETEAKKHIENFFILKDIDWSDEE